MTLTFQGLGWEVRLRYKRRNYFLTLAKELVLGNGLKPGDQLKYFLVNYESRNCVLIALDGQGFSMEQKIKKNVYLVKT